MRPLRRGSSEPSPTRRRSFGGSSRRPSSPPRPAPGTASNGPAATPTRARSSSSSRTNGSPSPGPTGRGPVASSPGSRSRSVGRDAGRSSRSITPAFPYGRRDRAVRRDAVGVGVLPPQPAIRLGGRPRPPFAPRRVTPVRTPPSVRLGFYSGPRRLPRVARAIPRAETTMMPIAARKTRVGIESGPWVVALWAGAEGEKAMALSTGPDWTVTFPEAGWAVSAGGGDGKGVGPRGQALPHQGRRGRRPYGAVEGHRPVRTGGESRFVERHRESGGRNHRERDRDHGRLAGDHDRARSDGKVVPRELRHGERVAAVRLVRLQRRRGPAEERAVQLDRPARPRRRPVSRNVIGNRGATTTENVTETFWPAPATVSDPAMGVARYPGTGPIE